MRWTLLLAMILTFNISQATDNGEVIDGLTWYTDLAKAHQVSESTNKPIFGFFTGSDWCGWCKLLQKNVFQKELFIKWANENVVLLELDFPKKTAQSPELRTQNQNLQRALGVRGYPTVWLFNATFTAATGGYNLSKIGKLGYPRTEPGNEASKFVEEANALLKNTTTTP